MKLLIIALPTKYNETGLVKDILGHLRSNNIAANAVVVDDKDLLLQTEPKELLFCKELLQNIESNNPEDRFMKFAKLYAKGIIEKKIIIDIINGRYTPYLSHLNAEYIIKYAKIIAGVHNIK